MKRFVLGVGALLAGWMLSRGHKDPREWPRAIPRELTSLWDDLDDAFGAARRAAGEREKDFDEEMRQARAER